MPEAGVEFANVSYALASDASGRLLIKGRDVGAGGGEDYGSAGAEWVG